MIKIALLLLILAAAVIFPARFFIAQGGFIEEGVMEGIQSCRKDSDCVWAETTCCGCGQGGGETPINKEKIWIFNLLVKPVCQGEIVCEGENACHNEQVYCDRTCKFGKRVYTPSLLVK